MHGGSSATNSAPTPQSDVGRRYAELCRGCERPPDVFAFLNAHPDCTPAQQAEVIVVDQSLRIHLGLLRPVEEYLANCPRVAADKSLCLMLLLGEFHARQQGGEEVSPETFAARFPEFKSELQLTFIETPAVERSAGGEESLDSASPNATVEVSINFLSSLNEQEVISESEDTVLHGLEQGPTATAEWSPSFKLFDQSLWRSGEQLEEKPATEESDANSERTLNKGEAPTAMLSPSSSDDATLYHEGTAYEEFQVGSRFADYELLGEIARGGMGVVFRARQVKLNRVVALKMILAGKLAGEEDVSRFYAEAEAAAKLDHPNIVPVYEVGEHRGQHFFSMGFVDGSSLAEQVAEHPLPADEAAEFVRVTAKAVDYAHDRGVIHRDLKPANVLVDADGQPKVTDFGLAKISQGKEDLTTTGQIMGTPNYMPPEQAAGAHDRVGPHSDVYSLGAVLYCLLTGRPPFQAPTVLEMLRQVAEQDPVSPRRLNPGIPVDLETICLKCLDKDPKDRYATAGELAADLQRFQSGIPVLARPVGRSERLWRWCRRNPMVAGLMAAVAASLLLGVVFSTYYAMMANRRAAEAEANLQQADRNFRKAREAVDRFFVRVTEDTLLNQPGMQPLQHELLTEALDYYRQFLDEREDDPSLRDELAETHFRVGLITEAIESPEAALPSIEKALALQQELLAESPNDVKRLKAVGDTLTALARVRFRSDGAEAALDTCLEAVTIREKILEQDEDAGSRREFANSLMNLGLVQQDVPSEVNDAILHLQEAQTIREEVLRDESLDPGMSLRIRRDLAMGWFNLGQLTHHLGHDNPAAYFQQAVTAFQSVVDDDRQDQQNRHRLATCHLVLGDHRLDIENPQVTLEHYRQAETVMTQLVGQNDRIAAYAQTLGRVHLAAGYLHMDRESHESAETHFSRGITVLDRSLEEASDETSYLIAIELRRALASVLKTVGKAGDARNELIAARRHAEELLEQDPESLDYRWEMGSVLLELGHAHADAKKHMEAATTWDEGRTAFAKLAKDFPHETGISFDHALLLRRFAELRITQDRAADAKQLIEESIAILNRLFKESPEDTGISAELESAKQLRKRLGS